MVVFLNFFEIKYISPKKGKGVFAKKNIKQYTTIEVANIILLPNKDYDMIQKTVLYGYCFVWDDPKKNGEFKNAIAFSDCQFINHSFDPNLKYFHDYDNKAIEFISIRDISKGEELTVNYNGNPDDKAPMWFDVK